LILLRRRVFSSTASATRRRTRASSLGSISIAPEDRRKISLGPRVDETPVTTFKRSTRLYNIAMSYNSQRGYNLDRDHDGIACEKR
jgi:hypothetical protein